MRGQIDPPPEKLLSESPALLELNHNFIVGVSARSHRRNVLNFVPIVLL